jgi:glutamate synthase (NADPH/NADH) small chain
VWRDDWEKALERLHATNNFPEFTGRLCPAPCETGVRGRHQPRPGDDQERRGLDHRHGLGATAGAPEPPEWLTGKTVAVIGSGPAGLAVAQQLTRAGHTVAVYERADKPGGLLRYGIPEFKMEKLQVDRRIDQMRREGTVFRSGVEVGTSITGHQLRDAYDAVVLAIGATVARDLPTTGPRARRHPPGDGVPPAGQPRGAGGDRGGPDPGHRQGRRDHRRRRHRRRLPGHRGAPAGALGHPAGDHAAPRRGALRGAPVAHLPDALPGLSAHEEAGERVYAVSTQEFIGDESGNVAQLHLVEVEMVDGRFTRCRVRAVIPAQLSRSRCFPPRAGGIVSSSGWRWTRAATSSATATT